MVGTRDGESIWLLRCATCAYSAVMTLPPDIRDSTDTGVTFGGSGKVGFAAVDSHQTVIGREDDDEIDG